jgi:phage gp16-like protein
MRISSSAGRVGRAANFIRRSRTETTKMMTDLDDRAKKLRGAIMAVCAKLGLDEETRRDLFERLTNKRSLTQMHPVDLAKILDDLNLTKNPVSHAAKGVQNKVYALWMSA